MTFYKGKDAIKKLLQKNKKNLKIVLTYLNSSGIVYLVAGQESSEDEKKHLRGVAQLG